MQIDPDEVKGGYTWLGVAGGLGVIFCVWMYNVDHHLSTSDMELEKAKRISEARIAQTTIAGGSVDPRVSKPFLASNQSQGSTHFDGEFHPRVKYGNRVGEEVPKSYHFTSGPDTSGKGRYTYGMGPEFAGSDDSHH